MDRIIGVSDIHGCDEEFQLLLEKVKYKPDKDRLFLLGDYVDKGRNPKLVLERVMQLKKEYGAEVIGGNHENIFHNWVHGIDYARLPYFLPKVGGQKTAKSYCPHIYDIVASEKEAQNYIRYNYQEHLTFIETLPYYIETDGFIFVHAGVDPSLPDWKDTPLKKFRWIRADFHHEPFNHEKRVVFGHTATKELHGKEFENGPWIHENKIGIDGGCVYGGQLNCILIENGEVRFDHVKSTYPLWPKD